MTGRAKIQIFIPTAAVLLLLAPEAMAHVPAEKGQIQINLPTISETFEFNRWVGLAISLGFGYKLFNDRARMTDNVYDLRVDWSIPVRETGELYLEPAFHAAWTNLAGRNVGQEYIVWASLNMGVDL